jgi:hypothetical protein
MTQGNYLYSATDLAGWTAVGTSDLTGDGYPDLLWQNPQTGEVRLFRMTFFSKVGEQTTGLQPPKGDWRVVATGDFNNDGKADIVLQHQTSGIVAMWIMNNAGGVASAVRSLQVTVNGSGLVLGSGWHIVGSADFDGDGHRDLALQNTNNGALRILGLNAPTSTTISVKQDAQLAAVNPQWQLRAVADYTGDGKADALFQHTATGGLYLWARSGNGFVPLSYLTPSAVALDWEVAGPR